MAQIYSMGVSGCESCPVRPWSVCACCDTTDLLALGTMKYTRHFKAGQPIIWSGEEMDFVGSVVTGAATLSQTLEDGRVQMVGLSLPGDFIGRPLRRCSPYDIRAASAVQLCCFRRTPFEQLLAKTPHLMAQLLTMTMDELDIARQWMLILGRKSAREKITSFLMMLVQRDRMTSGGPKSRTADVILPLTRESIANYLGLSIETVSRQFTVLRRDGVIVLRGSRQVHIPDVATLARETGDDAAQDFRGLALSAP